MHSEALSMLNINGGMILFFLKENVGDLLKSGTSRNIHVLRNVLYQLSVACSLKPYNLINKSNRNELKTIFHTVLKNQRGNAHHVAPKMA